MSRSEAFDLAIRGGEVVTSRGRARADVYVRDGRIAAVTADRHDAAETADAGGLLVMPGMVDAHVHFMDPGDPDREDFVTGSAAAARAGVTTVVEHTHVAPVIAPADLEAKRRHVAGRSRVDFALAAHGWPDRLDEVEPVWRAGACFVKAFTCTTHGVPGFGPADLHELFARAAACDAVCLVHAEEESLVDGAERRLRAAGRTDPGIVPEWRTPAAELTALAITATLAKVTGVRAITAHVSHPAALEVVARERAAGARLQVESCPQYLSLLAAEVLEHCAFRKFTPPARARDTDGLDAMWAALASGAIDFMSSDHAPATAAQKRDGSIWDVHFGLPGVDTTLSVLLDGAAAGRITY
jgi:dihydroorotase-like cyclic amidohydrolase